MEIPTLILNWLLQRNISHDVLTSAGISFADGKILIPVKDLHGNHLFFKKRKNPFEVSDAPKYTYEKGSEVHLYNAHTIVNLKHQDIFITEGEFDSLLLNSLGFLSVSSTGGAKTFRPDWVRFFFNNNVYIVYDRDEAGIKGALHVQSIIPWAKIIFLPYTTKGKDVTDYFQTHTIKQFLGLVENAQSWEMPYEPSNAPRNKSAIDAVITNLRIQSDALLEKRRALISDGQDTNHIDILSEMIDKRKEFWKKERTNFRKIPDGSLKSDVERARDVPISQFITFDYNGKAKCIFHSEKSASLTFYPKEKHVYCFGCGVRKDIIDVVQQKYGLDFKSALKLILNKR